MHCARQCGWQRGRVVVVVVVMGASPPYRKNRRTASALTATAAAAAVAAAAAAAVAAAAAITTRLARHLALRMITDREAERMLSKEVHAARSSLSARARDTKGFAREEESLSNGVCVRLFPLSPWDIFAPY